MKVQAQVREQQERMRKTQREMIREQSKKEEELKKEKERGATRQWWKTPYSSSTTAWVHSGGANRTNPGEVRPWTNTLDESMMAQTNESTINLDDTVNEMEVLVLDQDLGDMDPELEERGEERMDTQEQTEAKGREGKTNKDQ